MPFDSILSLLPRGPGLLPSWQLLVSGMAFGNTVQNFHTLSLTRRIYTRKPSEVTGLQARTSAMWTFISAVVRLYCAYHVNEKTVYDITIWTYIAALGHFASEWLLFGSADLGKGLLGPLIIAPVSLVWMVRQYDFYVPR